MAVAHNKDIQINLKELAKTFDDDLKLKNPLVYMVYTKNLNNNNNNLGFYAM